MKERQGNDQGADISIYLFGTRFTCEFDQLFELKKSAEENLTAML